jgi:hypothetical protein
MTEFRAKLSSGARGDLPDSAFAYVEPGKPKVNGKTEDKYRHYPVHDAAHARNALARAGQGARFAKEAMPKIMAAAKKHGVHHGEDAKTGRSLESLFPEVRFIADKPELRTAAGEDGEVRHITGYASVFNKISRRLGNFHEQVMPSAFTDSLRNSQSNGVGEPPLNVVCRYNHKDDMVLGTTLGGTLRLEVDERGLRYDVIPPNHREDVMELVDRGDVRYSSFAFQVEQPGVDDTWGESEFGIPMRSLHKVRLVDVAPVLDPAYKDTTATARNLAGAIESLASWVDGDPAEIRSMLETGQAARLFHRTDKLPVIKKPEVSKEETRVLDDPAVSLRTWRYDDVQPADEVWSEPDERIAPDEDELRAALKSMDHSKLCKQWVHGEPCVRPAGHGPDGDGDGDGEDGGHRPLCYARKGGLPCPKPMGHDGDHEPMDVKTRDAEEGETPEEGRNGESEEPKTLTGPEAMAKMLARKRELTQLPE